MNKVKKKKVKKKLVINGSFGGFGLSDKAIALYLNKKNISYTKDNYFRIKNENGEQEIFSEDDLDRKDPTLIEVVEELGKDANGDYARLVVISLDEGTLYRITSYDGSESVELMHEIQWDIA